MIRTIPSLAARARLPTRAANYRGSADGISYKGHVSGHDTLPAPLG